MTLSFNNIALKTANLESHCTVTPAARLGSLQRHTASWSQPCGIISALRVYNIAHGQVAGTDRHRRMRIVVLVKIRKGSQGNKVSPPGTIRGSRLLWRSRNQNPESFWNATTSIFTAKVPSNRLPIATSKSMMIRYAFWNLKCQIIREWKRLECF